MATYWVRQDGNNANTGLGDSAAAAWKTIVYAIRNANNGVLAAGDLVCLVGDQGNFTENNLTPDRDITIRGIRGATRGKTVVSGAGGAAGSDVFTSVVACRFIDIICQDAVDQGIAPSATGPGLLRCEFNNNGGAGGGWFHSAPVTACSFRGNGGVGAYSTAGTLPNFSGCEFGDNVGDGMEGNPMYLVDCLSYDNGGHGYELIGTSPQARSMRNCTAEGCTGDGLRLGATTQAPQGSLFLNCSFTNCGGYGANSSAGAQTAEARSLYDYCNFFGNGTAARNNWPTGLNDVAVDPDFVNAAGDDLTLATGSLLIGAGYFAGKDPMKANIGATIAEVASPGGSPLVGGGLVR